MHFHVYAFADYSGSATISTQRKRIVLAIFDRTTNDTTIVHGMSRFELWLYMCLLLKHATKSGKRVIFGFDHSYSFPQGFYEIVYGLPWRKWSDLTCAISQGNTYIPPVGDSTKKSPVDFSILDMYRNTRTQAHDDELFGQRLLQNNVLMFKNAISPQNFAQTVNTYLKNTLRVPGEGGPFWGPSFPFQKTKPRFPYETYSPEKRLVEQNCLLWQGKHMKSIYQLGGHGSVGLQSLYGIAYLGQLLRVCHENAIPIFAWPFDGWLPPFDHHVLLEVYPTLYNREARSDETDARACIEWFKEEDNCGRLHLARPSFLSDDTVELVRREGWVHGVAPTHYSKNNR